MTYRLYEYDLNVLVISGFEGGLLAIGFHLTTDSILNHCQ